MKNLNTQLECSGFAGRNLHPRRMRNIIQQINLIRQGDGKPFVLSDGRVFLAVEQLPLLLDVPFAGVHITSLSIFTALPFSQRGVHFLTSPSGFPTHMDVLALLAFIRLWQQSAFYSRHLIDCTAADWAVDVLEQGA